MKKFMLLLMPLALSFLFSGCSILQVNYEDKFVDFNSVKTISNKNNNFKINISDLNYSISKKPNSFYAGAFTMNLNDSFNENILKSVLSQYFNNNNIYVSNEKSCDIFVDSKIIDFDWEASINGQITNFKIEISVLFKNNLILHKTYMESFKRNDVYFGFKIDSQDMFKYITNQHLFELYQTKFIPDLAEALKANQ